MASEETLLLAFREKVCHPPLAAAKWCLVSRLDFVVHEMLDSIVYVCLQTEDPVLIYRL